MDQERRAVSTRRNPRSGAWSYLLALAASLGVLLDSSITSRGFRITLFDDSMISMAYGRTLAEGGGFRWFPGAPAVEGVTNPLWVVYMAALHLLHLPSTAIMVIVAATGAVSVVVAAQLLSRMMERWASLPPRSSVCVFLASSLCLPVVYWSVRGMEVGFLVLVSVGAVWAATSGRAPAGRRTVLVLCIAAGMATRQDFAVTVGAVVIWQLWHARRSRVVRIDLLVAVGAFLATLALVSVWRHLDFGALVPNTYQLKIDGFPLRERIARGVRTTAKLYPIVVLGVLGFLRLRRTAGPVGRAGVLAVLVVACANLGYCIFIGGDAWEAVADRFCSTPLVLFAALAVGGLHDVDWLGLVHRVGRFASAAVVMVFVILSCIVLSIEVHRSELGLRRSVLSAAVLVVLAGTAAVTLSRLRLWRSTGAVAVVTMLVFWCTSGMSAALMVGRRLGDTDADRLLSYTLDRDLADLGAELRDLVDPQGVVAVTAAGAPVYFSGRPAVDILGKNDPVIARQGSRLAEFWPGHSKWDYQWTFGVLRPDIIAQLWWSTPDDLRYIEGIGYRCRRIDFGERQGDMWILTDSEHVTAAARNAPPCE